MVHQNTDDDTDDIPARNVEAPARNTFMAGRRPSPEVADAVGFARLMAMSSLGDQEAIEDRLVGRKEIAALYPPPTSGRRSEEGNRIAAGEEIEMQVAEELELRGYTFEAELRYRRLLHLPGAASRLALLLEAKGFRRESWKLYAQAAAQHDAGSLLRLAVICHQRGESNWAHRLATAATGALGATGAAELHENAEQFRAARRGPDGLYRISAEPLGATSEQTYALGSLLFVCADRPDLARVAYCSALARGHTLSAVSLLDLALPQSHRGGRYLDRLLTLAQERDGLLRCAPTDSDPGVARPLASLGETDLRSTVGTTSIENLLGAARRGRSGAPERRDAIDRIGQIAKTITLLRSYSSTSCTTAAIRTSKEASLQVATETQQEAQDGRWSTSGTTLLRYLWRRCDEVLHTHQLTSGGTQFATIPGNSNPTDDPAAEATTAEATTAETKEAPPGTVTGSGAVYRLRNEFHRLPHDELRVLVLNHAGITVEDTSEVIDKTHDQTAATLTTAITRLHAGQAGEQQHPGANDLLWKEVENALEHV